ncbi:MAG: hypothetical protein ACTHMV_19965 [Chitinophagaceae bacterium]
MLRILLIPMIALLIGSVSCSKDDLPDNFVGEWTINQVYANDSWGAPFYWQNALTDTRIKFTSAKQYFRKYHGEDSYTLIGTYRVLPDNKIEITWDTPPNSSAHTYKLDYTFEKGGFMTWGILASEGVIKEKFKKNW